MKWSKNKLWSTEYLHPILPNINSMSSMGQSVSLLFKVLQVKLYWLKYTIKLNNLFMNNLTVHQEVVIILADLAMISSITV